MTRGEEAVRKAIEELTPEDTLRLRRSARIIIMMRTQGKNVAGDDMDLLQEALTRALAGTRKWPEGVPFLTFLVSTMQGIAWNWRKRPSSEMMTYGLLPPRRFWSALAFGSAQDPVALIQSRDLVREIFDRFAEDEDAIAVLCGWGEGLTRDETCERYGICTRQFDAARKRIRRTPLRGLTEPEPKI